MSPTFGLIIVGDEILSGKRADKHLPRVIDLLSERGLALAYAEYLGDDPARITATLQRAFASGDVVLCCGGIGATPDDHTRACAAAALGVPLQAHTQAQALIRERIQDMAREQYPTSPASDNRTVAWVNYRRAQLIPNPYNKIAGFSCTSPQVPGGCVHFVPGFPVMAWPMIEWVLQHYYAQHFHQAPQLEQSVIVYQGLESTLTPLMERLEAQHPGIKVFSLPSVNHPEHGWHIELGVKGAATLLPAAWAELLQGLQALGAQLGPQMQRQR